MIRTTPRGMKRTFAASLLTIAAMGLCAAPAAAQIQPDAVTVGNVTSTGAVVDVPVYIRDMAGTPLGVDQPAGSKIQSYSIKVIYTPTAPVQSVTFSRSGITSSLTPAFESSPATPGTISLLDTFQESTNPIPFVSNAPAPGNVVAHLLVTLSPSATPGTVIALNLDPTLTQLTDEGGDSGTRESFGDANLNLISGSITVGAAVGPPAAPTLSTWALIALALSLAALALRLRL